MSAYFGAYFDPESGPAGVVRDPPAIYHKNGLPAPNPLELDEMAWGGKHSGLRTPTQSGTQTPYPEAPRALNEFTNSRPPTPKRDEAAGLVQSWNNPPQNRWRVLACCLIYFGNGMSDSGPGALIPHMQEDYSIKYAIVYVTPLDFLLITLTMRVLSFSSRRQQASSLPPFLPMHS